MEMCFGGVQVCKELLLITITTLNEFVELHYKRFDEI